jgi:hypothetical protein
LIPAEGRAIEFNALGTLEGEEQRVWHTKKQAAAPKTGGIVPVNDTE